MARWLIRILLVTCSTWLAFQTVRLLRSSASAASAASAAGSGAIDGGQAAKEKAKEKAKETAKETPEALKVVWNELSKPSGNHTNLRDDTKLLDRTNTLLKAEGSGIAPEVMSRMSMGEGRLAQWLFLTFEPPERAATSGPGAAARRTLNRLVIEAIAPKAQP